VTRPEKPKTDTWSKSSISFRLIIVMLIHFSLSSLEMTDGVNEPGYALTYC